LRAIEILQTCATFGARAICSPPRVCRRTTTRPSVNGPYYNCAVVRGASFVVAWLLLLLGYVCFPSYERPIVLTGCPSAAAAAASAVTFIESFYFRPRRLFTPSSSFLSGESISARDELTMAIRRKRELLLLLLLVLQRLLRTIFLFRVEPAGSSCRVRGMSELDYEQWTLHNRRTFETVSRMMITDNNNNNIWPFRLPTRGDEWWWLMGALMICNDQKQNFRISNLTAGNSCYDIA